RPRARALRRGAVAPVLERRRAHRPCGAPHAQDVARGHRVPVPRARWREVVMSAAITFYAGMIVGIGLCACTKALAQRGQEVDDAYERWLRDLEREAASLEAE